MRAQNIIRQTKDWDKFIQTSEHADILQSWEWGEVKKSEQWEPRRFVVIDDNKIVATAQVLKRNLSHGLHLLYAPHGPILNWSHPHADTIFEILINTIQKEHANKKTLLLKVGPRVMQDEKITPQVHDIFEKHKLVPGGRSIQPQYTTVVDLVSSEDDILNRFEKDTRYNVRRAERENIKLSLTNGKDDQSWSVFYNLYMETVKRGQFSARSKSQFKRIQQFMAPKGNIVIGIAYFENEPLAAAVVASLGAQAFYLWGGSSRNYTKKFAAYLLQWELIKHLKSKGIKSYDLWGIAPTNSPKELWAGHTLFKKGFGGQNISFIGDYDLPLSPLYKPYRIANWLRESKFHLSQKLPRR